MPKLTPEDLARISEKVRQTTQLRDGAGRARITIHMGTCGIAAGARTLMTALMQALDAKQIHDVLLTSSGCAGLCSQEPMMTVQLKDQPPVKYVNLDAEKAVRILDEHVQGGQIVEACALGVGSERMS